MYNSRQPQYLQNHISQLSLNRNYFFLKPWDRWTNRHFMEGDMNRQGTAENLSKLLKST